MRPSTSMIVALVLAIGSLCLRAQQQASISISGTELSSDGVWNTGTATLTVNGYSRSVPYGQFSSSAGIASAFGGLLSEDPNSPVNGQAFGSTLKLLARSSRGGILTSVQLTFDKANSPFHASAPSLSPLTAFAVVATPNPAGAGNPIQLTVNTTPANATGSIAIYDDGNLLGIPHVANGLATLSIPGLAAGPHHISAYYKGDNNYFGATSPVVVLPVVKNTPIVTWPAPASIRPGTPLSSTQLNATANVPGTFVYSPAAGVIPGNGTQVLSATFSPSDTADYVQTNTTTSLNVNGTQFAGSAGIISTFAGNGSLGSDGDGGFATNAALTGPVSGIATDASDNIYYCDGYHRVRKITAATGLISTVAGNDIAGYSGDGGLATSATLNCYAITSDAAGDIFVGDIVNQRIRKISASTGIISTVAGNGTAGYSGDGGTATSAAIELQNTPTAEYPDVTPIQLAVDAIGDIYFYNANQGGHPGSYDVRIVSASTGIISTFANGQLGSSTSSIYTPHFTVDPNGTLYVSYNGSLIYKATSSSSRDNPIAVYAGTGQSSGTGDGGLATNAQVSAAALATDSFGNLYFYDGFEKAIRQVNATTGIIRAIAILGDSGEGCQLQTDSLGDGCLSPDAPLSVNPLLGIAVDSGTNVYVPDPQHRRIRTINPLLASQVQPSTVSASCPATLYGSNAACNVSINGGGTGTVSLAYPSSSSNLVAYEPDTLYVGSTLIETLPSSALRVGSYPVVATYSGDLTHVPSYVATSLTVSPPTPVISWSAPAPITVGTPLGPKQLNASTTVPGLLTYLPTFNRILPVGSNSLQASFVPSDSSNYTSATATQTLQVLPATPTVSWLTPAPIQYGTPLSAAQLDATANVAGSFSYAYAGGSISPSSNTILPIGVQTLSVTFTPNNSTNNTSNAPLTASVQLSVIPDIPNIRGILPNPVPVGATVTIVGKNLGPTQASSTLTFNGVTAAATSWSDDTIVTTIPVGATTGNVVVTVGNVPSNNFLLMIPKPCP